MTLPGPIVILNYDILKSWLPALIASKPEILILDEISFCKSRNAQRTKAAIQLSQLPSSVVGLSGTPLTNRPIELWSILQIIRPDIFPDHNAFAWRYCQPKWDARWGWQFNGAANLQELHGILRDECMIRRLKKDVLKELPDKTRQVVSFKLDKSSLNEYNKAKTNFIGWLRGISPGKAFRAAKCQALVKVGYLLRLTAKLKLGLTVQWLTEFLESHPGEKLVCLTMNTFVIDHLAARFPRHVIIDGRVTGIKRVEAVRKFQSHSKVDFLFGNIKAAGLGLTLTAARQGVFLDFPWNPGDLIQGEDRVHRIGQTKDVIIHYLATIGTIEEKLIRILREKAATLDAVLNGQMNSTDLDVFDELLREASHE
jgi:SWI/SNF-related matrix-associated actin-dependent regulator 1 of chromatin subfamily A